MMARRAPVVLEGAISADRMTDVDGDPVGVFSCLLECSEASCEGLAVSVNGNIIQTIDVDDTGKAQWEFIYEPLFFVPRLNIFPIPETCPAKVRKEIHAAFDLFWSDPAACVNHQRTAIERLLTAKGIPRCLPNGKRKRQRIDLHKRIEMLPQKTAEDNQLRDSLLAIKFIGNEGSHAGYLGRKGALDGFGQLACALGVECGLSLAELKAVRQQINASKAPRDRADQLRQAKLTRELRQRFRERRKSSG